MQLRYPSWLSWYKKPEYRDIKEYSTNISSGRRPLSPDRRDGTVPGRLRLDRILANKTCSPMSLYDFYMYLSKVEFSEENLEFYLWFKNYEDAYARGLATEDKDYGSNPSAAQSSPSVARFKDGDSRASTEKDDPESDDDDSEAAKETLSRISQLISTQSMCGISKSGPCSFPSPAANINTESILTGPAPPKLALLNPFSKHGARSSKSATGGGKPLPVDISTVIVLYLLPSSPKELNIPPALRTQALAELHRNGPSPDALRPVAEHVYSLMRNCSHKNFLRLGVGNGTFETVCVATVLGWINLAAGFLVVLLRALATPTRGAHSRWEAWAAWPLWWLGMSLVLSGLRGSCFFLLLFSRRQMLPWERFDEDGNVKVDEGGRNGGVGGRMRKGSVDRGREGAGGMRENKRVGGGGFSLWQSLKRLMIFDRRIKVQERHLRRLQRKIVLQSLAGGSVFATLCVALFICLPVWKETI